MPEDFATYDTKINVLISSTESPNENIMIQKDEDINQSIVSTFG